MVEFLHYISIGWVLFYLATCIYFHFENRKAVYWWDKIRPVQWFTGSALVAGVASIAGFFV